MSHNIANATTITHSLFTKRTEDTYYRYKAHVSHTSNIQANRINKININIIYPIMRKTFILRSAWFIILMLFLCSTPFSQTLSAQSVSQTKITVSMERVSLKSLCNELSKQSQFNIQFEEGQINPLSIVSVNVQNTTLKEALDLLMTQIKGTYTVEGKNIMITPKQKPGEGSLVKGQIVDTQGIPLTGVTIRMRGLNGGYISDLDGRFEILTQEKEVYLTFTYVGYKTAQRTVKNGTTAHIVMEEDGGTLGEVVVTGYGTKNKNSFTGSQVSVKRDQLMMQGTKNVLQSLSAFVPGMMIMENNVAGSDPNKMAEINIRGRATFEGTANMPVFVVDGSQVNAEYIYDMDMNDIENITVLKDASATALYGAKASAGVIVITTKALKGGKLKLNYSGTYRLSVPDLSDYNLLSPEEKLEFERLSGVYSSISKSSQYDLDEMYARNFAIVKSGVNTDWISKPLRNAFSHQHSLSVDGGDENARYNLGVRYSNDAGVMKGSGRERLSGNFKLSYSKQGKFYVSNTLTFNNTNSNVSPYGDFSNWVRLNPYESPYDQQGNLRQSITSSISNPLYEATVGSYNKSNNMDFLNTTSLQVWIGEKVRIDGDFSFQKSKSDSHNFVSPFSYQEIRNNSDVSRRGSLAESFSTTTSIQGKLMASYNSYLTDKLFLTAMAGSNFESNHTDGTSYSSRGFYTDKLGHAAFAARYADGDPDGSDMKSTGVGFYVNANAIWDNRYFLDVIYRYEGSSKFGKNNRFAPFWSMGGGWNIHKEKFMKNSPFQLLKLRASIGYLGNISFDPYQALTTYDYTKGYYYGKGVGAIPITIGNPALTWERTLNTNVGIDLTMFNGRWDFTAEYYIKNTDNLLLDITKAPSVGVTTTRENVGAVENKGVELSTRVIPIQTKDWQWSLSLNYSYNKNKIKQISNALKARNEENLKKGGLAPLPVYEEGQSLTALKVVPSAGIDPITGKEVFITRDGNYTFDYNANDKQIFGDTTPFGIGALSSYLTYKEFSFAATFQYSFGGAVYNETLASKVEGTNPIFNADRRVFTDRWKQEGDIAKFRSLTLPPGAPLQSSRFVETNNYLTLSSISLGYEVPLRLIQRYGIKRMRVELLANDLFYLSSVKRERGLYYPYSNSVEMSFRFSL